MHEARPLRWEGRASFLRGCEKDSMPTEGDATTWTTSLSPAAA